MQIIDPRPSKTSKTYDFYKKHLKTVSEGDESSISSGKKQILANVRNVVLKNEKAYFCLDQLWLEKLIG